MTMRYDHEIASQIIEAVVLGMEPERAALAYGIPAAVHDRWIAEGMAGAEPTGSTELVDPSSETAQLVEYVRALEQAVARAELYALGKVRASDTANPDAWRWFLERRFPDRWAKTPAAARAAEMQTRDEPAAETSLEDDGDEVDEVKRKREEKRRAAGGNG